MLVGRRPTNAMRVALHFFLLDSRCVLHPVPPVRVVLREHISNQGGCPTVYTGCGFIYMYIYITSRCVPCGRPGYPLRLLCLCVKNANMNTYVIIIINKERDSLRYKCECIINVNQRERQPSVSIKDRGHPIQKALAASGPLVRDLATCGPLVRALAAFGPLVRALAASGPLVRALATC